MFDNFKVEANERAQKEHDELQKPKQQGDAPTPAKRARFLTSDDAAKR